MKIAMLGWEYPPRISGGLGVASQGLAKALADAGNNLTFYLPAIPKAIKEKGIQFVDVSRLRLDTGKHVETKIVTKEFLSLKITEMILPYLPPTYFRSTEKKKVELKKIGVDESIKLLKNIAITGNYTDAIHNELKKYAVLVSDHIADTSADIVHAHDWMTFPAGKLVSEKLGIPFVAHIHSTEHDRNDTFSDPRIVEIEKEGVTSADLVVTVSNYVADSISTQYGVPKDRIRVVPNGWSRPFAQPNNVDRKVIGFLGRFADQKAPGKFLDIARELLNRQQEISFSMAGDGYLMESLKNKINQLNLKRHLELKGFVKPNQVPKWMEKIRLLIVPSVAEPFGLVALEAIQCGVPVIISRGAGICEFIPELKQVDHWDIYNFTTEAEQLLNDPKKAVEYVVACQKSAKSLSWVDIGRNVSEIYREVIK